MISAKVLVKQIERLAVDNMPVILTAVATVGAVGTAVLSTRATIKAVEIYDDERERRLVMNQPVDISKLDVVRLVWVEYLPAAGVCTATVASVIFANRISAKRAAVLAAAYSMSERNFTEYKDKAREKLGIPNADKVDAEIAQERVTAKPPVDSQIIITGNGDVLVYDMPSDRYFRGNVEKVRRIENDLNAMVNEAGSATLGDFQNALGLNPTDGSDIFGWTPDQMLYVTFSGTLTNDNQPCIALNYSFKRIAEITEAGSENPPF